MTSDRETMLAGILADPGNDLRRLVFADLLEENGEGRRAELIRLAVEWESIRYGQDKRRLAVHKRLGQLFRTVHAAEFGDVTSPPVSPRSKADFRFVTSCDNIRYFWKRGFVDAVELPAWRWLGQCAACRGRGPADNRWVGRRCVMCQGHPDSVRSLAVGPALSGGHPLTEVRFTDRCPHPDSARRRFSWVSQGRQHWSPHTTPRPLEEYLAANLAGAVWNSGSACATWPDVESALAAMSEASLRWARDQPRD